MIDYEVDIFDRVYQAVAPLCAKGRFTSTPIIAPTSFPAGCLMELDNSTVKERQSSTPGENYARLMYQLDVYATTKGKSRQVYKAADDVMLGLGFTRTGGQFIPNLDNNDVFRYTARYEAEIDPDGVIYRRR